MGGAGMNNTIDNRREVLKTAVKHIEIWFSPTEWVDFERQTKTGTIQRQKRRPDMFCLELFDGDTSPQITEGDLKHFFQIFGLTNRVSWNWIKVATCINAVRSSAAFDPAKDIPSLAERLRDCNKRQMLPISAASKIAVFSKPKAKVFIWDKFAQASARSRDRQRGTYDNYPSFFEACERALEDERKTPDFRSAVDEVDRKFRSSKGLMSNRARIPVDFIERRLLDKLMFCEGYFLKEKKLPDA
jgi:hypothetical protein